MSKRTRNRFPGPRPGDFRLGSPQSRAAARAILLACDQGIEECQAAKIESLTSYERALMEDENGIVRYSDATLMLVRNVIEKNALFGRPQLTLEEARLRRRIPEEITKIEAERRARGEKGLMNKSALWQMALDRLHREAGDRTGPTTAADAKVTNDSTNHESDVITSR